MVFTSKILIININNLSCHSPENFSSEAVHQLLEILIQQRSVQSIEEIVSILLVLHEQLQILEYLLLHGTGLIVSDQSKVKEHNFD